MKITTPNEMTEGSCSVEEALMDFEEQLKSKPKNLIIYKLIVDKHYNESVCKKIETLYLRNGWYGANCNSYLTINKTFLTLYSPEYKLEKEKRENKNSLTV